MYAIRESQSQSYNASVYIRSITRSTMHQKLNLLAGTGVWKISSVACWFCSIKFNFSDYPKKFNQWNNGVCCNHTCYCVNMVSVTSASRYIKIDYSDYPKSLISRIIEVCCIYTCYFVNMISVTSASRYITSASRYQ